MANDDWELVLSLTEEEAKALNEHAGDMQHLEAIESRLRHKECYPVDVVSSLEQRRSELRVKLFGGEQ